MMKRLISIILVIALIMPYFPFFDMVVAATNEYVVESIREDGTITKIGEYDNYSLAKIVMDSYNSTVNDVAVIKRNGIIVNAAYGIFRPNTSYSTLTMASDYGSTYISPAYNSDTLLLDYNPDNNKVLVMISGVKAWTNVLNGTIYPISYIANTDNLAYDVNKKYVKITNAGSIRLREGPGIEFNQVGCNGANQCDNGVVATRGNVYEWLNYGFVTVNGGYEWYGVIVNGNIGYIASANYLEEYVVSREVKQEYQTYYYVSNEGELYHRYYATAAANNVWTTRLGKAPLYLKPTVKYYSYDGNYFYDDFTKMVTDMRNNMYINAVNLLPYYNYYQYLPSRTQTVYNADNLNAYIGYNSKINRDDYYELRLVNGKYEWVAKDWWANSSLTSFPSGQSMLYQEGQAFIDSQNKYGVNAAQTLALAINESGWGRSYMSVKKYNIFGHGAFDSAPDEYAAGYESISAGIMAHANKYIAKDYSNPLYGAHYYGSHYGNKLSGNNVSYASDAYWGEKMAGNYYLLDKNFSFQDYNQRKVFGIKQVSIAAPVYSLPTFNSIKYYDLKAIPNIPVTILEEVIGEEVNGNNIWYKIQSDLPIDEYRQLVDLNLETYNFDTSYAYIHSSYIYKDSGAPLILANNIVINSGTVYNPLNGIMAYDSFDGDITNKVVVTFNNVNPSKVGVYAVTYKVTDSENNTTEKSIYVTVLESKPIMNANDVVLNAGATFNPLSYVVAYDYEDGDLTSKVVVTNNNVDVNTPGKYFVTYSVLDSNNNLATKTINVTILEPVYKEIENLFGFDSIIEFNNNLKIKGFVTLKDVQNNLSNNIKYRLLFKNELTGQESYQELSRIIDINNIPYVIEGENGLDYTYSWFEGNIDINSLANGDYTLYVVANDNEYITEVPISNVFGSPMVSTYTTSNKSVFIRNNYESRQSSIQLFVRDSLIGKKNSSSEFNIINEYSTINFIGNNLVIRGASHIIGGNYSIGTFVTRNLILENVNTFKRYSYNIGSITNGDYVISLRAPDGYDKTRAWFETNIDLSSLESGTYAIYLSTASNVEDYGELQDIFARNIESVLIQNNKIYSFRVNEDKRFRIELIVMDV